MKGCVKKPYSERDAIAAVKEAKRECPEWAWFHAFCSACKGFHLVRMKRD